MRFENCHPRCCTLHYLLHFLPLSISQSLPSGASMLTGTLLLVKWCWHSDFAWLEKHTLSFVYLQSWCSGFIWQLLCCHTSGPEDINTDSVLFKSGTLWTSQREAAAAAEETNVAKSQHGWCRNEQCPHVRPCCELCVMEQNKMSDVSGPQSTDCRSSSPVVRHFRMLPIL